MKILQYISKLAVIKVEAGIVSVVDEYRIEMEINELKNQLALLKDKECFLETPFKNLIKCEIAIFRLKFPRIYGATIFSFQNKQHLIQYQLYNHQLLRIDFQQSALAIINTKWQANGKTQY